LTGKRGFSGGSLWQRLALLFAVILLPPTVLSGLLAWDSFSEHTKRAMLSVRQFAVLAATYERRFFEDTRDRLQRLAGEPAILSADPALCATLLNRTLEAYPEFTELAYFDPEGRHVCGTGNGAASVSSRPWFEDAVRFRSFTISDYTFSSSSLRPVIVAALPINDGMGQLRGVLSSSIELTWLSSFLREARLPPDGVFFLLDSNGNVLASSSSMFASADPALPKAAAGEAESRAEEGLNSVVRADLIDDVINRRMVDFEAIGKDDIRRVYSSVALPHGNVILLFGVPADVTLGWIERDLVTRVLSLAAIWLAGIVAAWLGTRWLVTRWIAPLRGMAQAYGRGDYSAKLDVERAPRELKDFGDTLMLMASRIEAREEDLRDSLAQKDVLLKEIHHRVKNNLQIVSSLLNIHGSRISGASEHHALDDIKTRVRALALVHRYLYEGDDVRLVGLRSFLTELCSTLVRSLADQTRRIRLEIDLPELAVLSDRAVPIALFITEVMTNSLKHAFPDARSGRIAVRFRFESETICVLEVADNGIGCASGGDTEDGKADTGGLGRQLMEAFARQLNGELSVSRGGGTRVTLRLDVRTLTQEGSQTPRRERRASAAA
jgi:two-component sensor histidine kinase